MHARTVLFDQRQHASHACCAFCFRAKSTDTFSAAFFVTNRGCSSKFCHVERKFARNRLYWPQACILSEALPRRCLYASEARRVHHRACTVRLQTFASRSLPHRRALVLNFEKIEFYRFVVNPLISERQVPPHPPNPTRLSVVASFTAALPVMSSVISRTHTMPSVHVAYLPDVLAGLTCSATGTPRVSCRVVFPSFLLVNGAVAQSRAKQLSSNIKQTVMLGYLLMIDCSVHIHMSAYCGSGVGRRKARTVPAASLLQH